MISLNLPINPTSFGNISVGILRYFYEKETEVNFFPIGQIDLSTQKVDNSFTEWINLSISKALKTYSRDLPIFKLWHLSDGINSYGKEQTLLTFYELDSPTDIEMNVVKNNKEVLVTNEYNKNIFEFSGAKNVRTIPLFYDKHNFYQTNKKYFDDNRITFNVVGKFEKRKNHEQIIKLWIKRFGNNPKYFLQCSIYNPFLPPEENQKIWSFITNNQRYFNVEFYPFMPENSRYNDYLNSADIVIGCGTESWGLPEFHSVCLGKHALILDNSGYKSWANKDNSVLIPPTGKTDATDNMFFKKGQPFNQGNIFTFSENHFMDGLDRVIKRVEENRINSNGIELQNKFTVKNTIDEIFKNF